ncbi:MAG: hypothetical protein GY721_11850, partial [Deltaproteobacteria bacterium]|nr:hypothetical protein [Deltaproteobacteria bacterium]
QIKGEDFDQTFSPVAAFRSLRVIFALSVQFGLRLYQLDVVAAFLNGVLDREIFMRQPRGFEDGTRRVCKLQKAIYGLKQSSRLWNEDLHSTLIAMEFSRCRSDPCLYFKCKGSSVMFFLVYVDDIIISTNDDDLYRHTLAGLKAEYELTESPSVSWVLGWHVSVSPSSIFVSQSAFVSSLLLRFGMSDSNAVCVPGVADMPGVDPRTSREAQSFTPSRYREAVGSLLFLTNCTRPDISYAVNVACRSMSSPTLEDWMRVKRIFRYLVGTASYGL